MLDINASSKFRIIRTSMDIHEHSKLYPHLYLISRKKLSSDMLNNNNNQTIRIWAKLNSTQKLAQL